MYKSFRACLLLTVLILTLLDLCAVSGYSAADPFISISNSFGASSETQRGFSWSTAVTIEDCWILYFPESYYTLIGVTGIFMKKASIVSERGTAGTGKKFKVKLTNLQPGARYVYRLVSADGSSTPPATFETAPASPKPFTFIAITDTQGVAARDYAVWGNTLDAAVARFPEAKFVVHSGDMVDAGDSMRQWDLFFKAAQKQMSRLSFEPAVGNHDALNRNGSNGNFSMFTQRFNTPTEEGTGVPAGTAYSFDYGNVHFAVMNTECGVDERVAQGDWLINDMKDSQKPWKIVVLHRGPYGAVYNSTDIRNAWSGAFEEAGVDLVLMGHEHNYVRSLPMEDGAVADSGGVVYICANGGGVKFYSTVRRYWQAVDLQPYSPTYVAVHVEDSRLRVEAYAGNNRIDGFSLDDTER